MDFRQATLAAGPKAKLNKAQAATFGAMKAEDTALSTRRGFRSLVWARREHKAAELYYKQTGEVIPVGAFDWAKLMDWLVENLPKILSIITTLLPFFLAEPCSTVASKARKLAATLNAQFKRTAKRRR